MNPIIRPALRPAHAHRRVIAYATIAGAAVCAVGSLALWGWVAALGWIVAAWFAFEAHSNGEMLDDLIALIGEWLERGKRSA